MTSEPKTLVLVDGSSYLYRAFHALPALTAPDGMPTGALYGVLNMLLKLREQHPSDLFAVVFDAPGRTFRDRLYADYKANRPPMPDDLRVQIEPLHELVRALGLHELMIPDVEADDVIGTLARQARDQGLRVLISTGDKDLAQLVEEHVVLLDTMKGQMTDSAEVERRFGVTPERIVDLLALVGDSVDNIPGVPKVGPKTAAKWLQAFGDLDRLMAGAGEVKGKVGENLRASLDQLPLSRELATIRTDVPLTLAPGELCPGEPDTDRLRELYRRFGFSSLLRQLEEQSPEPAAEQREYEQILSRDALDRWLSLLREAELFALDTETTSLNYMVAEVVGLCFALESGEAAYLPLAHDYPGAPEQLPRGAVLEELRPILEDEGRAKVGHNLKYDMSVLANHGVELRGIRYDSMLESYVWNSTATRHDLDSTAAKYLNLSTIHFEDVAGKGARQLTFNQVPLEQATPYAAEDAAVCLQLHSHLWPRLQAEPRLGRLLQDIEMPLVPVLSRMERTGVQVDATLLRRQGRELGERMMEIEVEAHRVAGRSFNLGSPKQLQEILFNELKLPVLRKTPKGQPSTAEEVLQELAPDYELPSLILQHRSLSKLKSTYTDKLVELVDERTGRVHTSYHQAVASTGRLSSSDPNLQNIPVRSAEGRRIRQAFVAPEGSCIVAADYSQIELRIMAHLSGDRGLLRAFEEGRDIHSATAAEVFGLDPEAVDTEHRRRAKAINFGLIYGMSAFGLSRQLGIPREEAREYVELYFARYPGVRAFMDSTRDRAREQGFIETVFGRRLHLPEIGSRNMQRRQAAERTAINAPMQGTAADIIKRAMIDLDGWLREQTSAGRMIMQVHDELVFEVPCAQATELRNGISERMSRAAELRVPLVVDVGMGQNWEEAH